MAHITESFSEKIIQKMQYFYTDYIIEPAPNGAIFRAKTDDAMITAYRSGKVLFQGKNPEKEAQIWQQFSDDTKKPVQQTLLSQNKSVASSSLAVTKQSHIGSDESGTGDYFGPVTACAVYVRADQIDTLRNIGIQDSKAIKDDTIKSLVKELVRMGIPYSSVVLPNEKYNQLQQAGWSQGKIKAMLHHTALEHVQRKVEGSLHIPIVIDQFCMPNVYANYLRSEGLAVRDNTHFMTKAETHSIAVAAASVIARSRFVEEMERLSESVGMTLLKGASQKVDQQIAKIIKQYGKGRLAQLAKVHFVNTKKAEKWM